jgi:DNA replication and repair protein RecF
MSAPRSPERGETLPATHAVFATASSPPREGVFPGTGSMQLAHLSLTTFRNYKSLEISFSPTHHLFIGQNGEGKTNLLESIHVLGCGSSMRGARDRTLVQHGERGFSVGGRLIDERRSGSAGLRAEVHYECGSGRETGSKRILVDRAPARASDLLAQVKVVPFAPADLELVQGAGAVRRRYLDTTGCQLQSEYLHALREYQRALRQRNETLARSYLHHHGRSQALRAREPWTELLIQHGGELMVRRADLVSRLTRSAAEVSRSSYRGAGPLQVDYDPAIAIAHGKDAASSLRETLTQNEARDEGAGFTTVGPHTDDLRLTLGGNDLRRYGSLGQQQLSAMFLKLAQAALVREIAQVMPILLVDEMFAILDKGAAEEFLRRVKEGGQIFLTTAHEGWLGELRARGFQVHRVQGGRVFSE